MHLYTQKQQIQHQQNISCKTSLNRYILVTYIFVQRLLFVWLLFIVIIIIRRYFALIYK